MSLRRGPPAIESLEPRALLSAFVYHPYEEAMGAADPFAQAGVDTATLVLAGANDALDLWGTAAGAPFVVQRGVYHRLSDLPGLSGSDLVIELNTAGTILGVDGQDRPFVWTSGVRTPIPAVFPGESFADPQPTLRAVDLTDNGKILLDRVFGDQHQAWVLDPATFTPSFALAGTPVAMNDRGDLATRGVTFPGLGTGGAVYDSATGKTVRLLNFEPTALSSSGRVGGTFQFNRDVTFFSEQTITYTNPEDYFRENAWGIGGLLSYFYYLSNRSRYTTIRATVLVPVTTTIVVMQHKLIDARSLAASTADPTFGEGTEMPGREISFRPTLVNDDGESLGYGYFNGTDQHTAQIADARSSEPIDQKFIWNAPTGLLYDNRSTFLRINDHGRVVGWDALEHRAFVLTRADVPPNQDFGGVAVSAAGGAGTTAGAWSASGDVTLIQSPGNAGAWTIGTLGGNSLTYSANSSSVAVFPDPATGLLTTVVGAGSSDGTGGLLFYSRTPPRTPSGYNPASYRVGETDWYIRNLTAYVKATRPLDDAQPIGGSITTIVAPDGRVHVFGVGPGAWHDGQTENRHLLVYTRESPATADADEMWTFQDITATDLVPRAQATPFFWTRPVGYVTPWGGLNIAGSDPDGRVHVVWTAPLLGHWEVADLTAITGAPPITGSLAAYVTPWNGLNLAGTDASGQLRVLWWAPALGPGNWQSANLTDIAGGPRLRPWNIAAYITPWNALSVAGIGEDGQVWVYWWTPETNRWVASSLSAAVPQRDSIPELHQGVGAAVTWAGEISVFATSRDGQVLRFAWTPMSDWSLENLSQTALHT